MSEKFSSGTKNPKQTKDNNLGTMDNFWSENLTWAPSWSEKKRTTLFMYWYIYMFYQFVWNLHEYILKTNRDITKITINAANRTEENLIKISILNSFKKDAVFTSQP